MGGGEYRRVEAAQPKRATLVRHGKPKEVKEQRVIRPGERKREADALARHAQESQAIPLERPVDNRPIFGGQRYLDIVQPGVRYNDD